MQTPNIKNSKFTTKVNDSFHYELSFPFLSYGKKYYMIRNNVLTACIPLYSILLKDVTDKEESYKVWTLMKIAGEKDRLFNDLKLFNSVEQYNANQSFIKIPSIRVDACFAKHNFGIRECGCWNRCVYGWTATNGGTSVSEHNTFSFDKVWFDEDGFHFIESAENKENNIFKTKFDAIESAKITNVKEFEDDDDDEDDNCFEIRVLDITLKMHADSEEDAINEVTTMIKRTFNISD